VRVRFTVAARADVADARQWYRRRDPALAPRFLRAVDECVDQLLAHPEIGPIVEGSIRRLLLRGFPYGVFYRLYGDEAVVIACLHGARSSRAWRRRSES
jgi:plasmid stabilization system protein ParE